MSDSAAIELATRISVVIPVLNEVDAIGSCLRQFEFVDDDVEVLVVDGGSEDDTRAAALATGSAHWVESERGRARQMNAGAAASTGEVLLFLHADSILPRGWAEDVRRAFDDDRVVGGRFRLGLSEGGQLFRLIAWMSTLRSRYLGITYGDQGIFVRRSVFDRLGGFPDREIFEDSEFCQSLARTGCFVMVEASVTASTRRWRKWGISRTVLWMWWLRFLYTVSVPDERLSRMYKDVR